MDLIYSVAASLDGFIAGPNGEYDWIPTDPEIDFEAIYAGFGGIVMGRRSYDVFAATGGAPGPALPTYVYSTTLPEGERGGISFHRDAVRHVRSLKASGAGKPLWLWGGGNLLRELADARLVDGVQIAVVPVILGGGVPLIGSGPTLRLELRRHRIYKTTGIVFLEYDVAP